MADRTEVMAEITIKAYKDADGDDFDVYGNIDGSIENLAAMLTDVAVDFSNFECAINLVVLQIREAKAKEESRRKNQENV